MAEEHRGGEATEPPSPKRLREARRRGEVARSRDFISAAVFIAVAAVLTWTWPRLVSELRQMLQSGIVGATATKSSPAAALEQGLAAFIRLSWPVLLAAWTCALLGALAQVGWLFTLQPVKPELRRLAPLRNLRQMFGRSALFELLKTLVKVLGIGYVAVLVLWQALPRILGTVGQPPERALLAVAEVLKALAIRVALLALALALLDLLYQRYAHRKRLKMTRLEVQREQKELEGDPQHRAERRRLHHEILEHHMLEAVAHADCVIVNPEHIAVALRYDPTQAAAPKVVARGERLMAAKIRAIARQHGIPIIRHVPLARALVELEVDEEIPRELYEAVAEVLRFIQRVAGRDGT